MANFDLIIMRHAKSDWDVSGRNDHGRPISPRGEQDANKMAAWLARQSFTPTLIMCSTALRAVQTAKAIAAEITAANIEWHDELYLASVDSLRRVAASAPEETCLVIGHNPGLEALLEYIDPPALKRSRFTKLMPTAAIYAFNIELDGELLSRACGRFIAHQRPKRLSESGVDL